MAFMRKTSLTFASKPEIAIFMDLDETYRPINIDHHRESGVDSLEAFWLEKSQSKNFIAGWVTGSNLDAVRSKTSNYVSVYPHFVASSLGSEFHWVRSGEFVESKEWAERISASGFSAQLVSDLINQIDIANIKLIKQKDIYQGRYKSSFFLECLSEKKFLEDVETLNELVKKYPIKLMVTQCSPAAGDPDNYYDVEFLPVCCGKDEAVKFVKEFYGITTENSFAFGDSCNDLSMFSCVGNAFWVANADAAARKNPYKIAAGAYCHGILNTLSQHF